ncbi:DNA-directed RNA polymerases I, II, and III subunit RPABC2 [Perkinsus olseni]|uniref:DNA-directed RNA polymerases I, II, and III subunit RPABC2 n=1 Tax=Perkinsus olseni TaxID=32597 RepID=A0A7J6PP27_PEROL|nr:DNA-directed RNA polymerases I, II, and III subunit RPABC2 [Perkinsus olseni]
MDFTNPVAAAIKAITTRQQWTMISETWMHSNCNDFRVLGCEEGQRSFILGSQLIVEGRNELRKSWYLIVMADLGGGSHPEEDLEVDEDDLMPDLNADEEVAGGSGSGDIITSGRVPTQPKDDDFVAREAEGPRRTSPYMTK